MQERYFLLVYEFIDQEQSIYSQRLTYHGVGKNDEQVAAFDAWFCYWRNNDIFLSFLGLKCYKPPTLEMLVPTCLTPVN